MIHGKKGCNDVHFDSIRDKKKFVHAADARAGEYCMATGNTSKITGITRWNSGKRTTQAQTVLSRQPRCAP
jgi:hypothetical protein